MKRRSYGKGSLFQNGRNWWMQYYVKGQRVKETTGTSDRAAAEKVLKRRLAEVELGQAQVEISPDKVTIAMLCQLLLDDYRLHQKSELKIATWRYHRHLEKSLGPVEARRATTKHFLDYIEERRKEASDSTINRELAIVRRGYTLAKRQDPPLVAKVPYIPKLKETNIRRGFLEPEQYERLLEELPLRLKALFVCAYHVGSRRDEVRKLRWEQVDLAGKVIRLEGSQTKNGKPRELPILGDMDQWLRFQQKTAPRNNPYVFHSERGRPVGKHLVGWKEACERAGMGGLIFHDLRRSSVRNLKRAGVQDTVAMKISGHLTRSVFDRYNITDGADIANAANQLEEYLKERKQKARPPLKRVK